MTLADRSRRRLFDGLSFETKITPDPTLNLDTLMVDTDHQLRMGDGIAFNVVAAVTNPGHGQAPLYNADTKKWQSTVIANAKSKSGTFQVSDWWTQRTDYDYLEVNHGFGTSLLNIVVYDNTGLKPEVTLTDVAYVSDTIIEIRIAKGSAFTGSYLVEVTDSGGVAIAAQTGGAVYFSDLKSKPTTLAGYGITDAVDTATVGVAGGVASLDATGKVPSAQVPLPPAVTASTGSSDAGKLIQTSGDGTIDLSLLPSTLVKESQVGVAGGLASLDSSAKVPTAQLPDSILGALKYYGVWNAATNTPTVVPASAANKGTYYKVSVAGNVVVDGNTNWGVGDWIVSDGTTWDKIDNTDAVVSVNGKTGIITLTAADVNAIATSLLGVANGVATLDSTGLIPKAQIPSGVGGGASSDVTVTTGTIAVSGSNQQMVALGKTIAIKTLLVNYACRVRLYSNSADLTADAGRSEIYSPPTGMGIVFDLVPVPGTEYALAPSAFWASKNTNYYMLIENRDTQARAISATMNVMVLEA
jgi:hypothetical protein